MNRFLYPPYIFFFLIIGVDGSKVDENNFKHNKSVQNDYAKLLNRISQGNKVFKRLYEKSASISDSIELLDSAKIFITHSIIEELIPYWYGTKWSYGGHTSKPKKGSIACGYFVSTILSHAGFNLDRYTLAKQNPINEVKSIHLISDIINFKTDHIDDLLDSIKLNLQHGLYIVGLDNHVGFLYNTNSDIYFIHSSYTEPFEVIKEIVSESTAFNSSRVYFIGEISTNDELIKKWLHNTEIKIVKL